MRKKPKGILSKKNITALVVVLIVVFLFLKLVPIDVTVLSIEQSQMEYSPHYEAFQQQQNQVNEDVKQYIYLYSLGEVLQTDLTRIAAGEHDENSLLLQRNQVNLLEKQCIWGETYILQSKNLFGEIQTTIFAPYVIVDARNIGTAGSHLWVTQLDVLSLSWQGNQLSTQERVKLNEVAITIKVDTNTYISDGSQELSIDNESVTIAGILEPYGANVNEQYIAHIHLGTRKSLESPDTEATARIDWSGELLTKTSAFSDAKTSFTLNIEQVYVNNLLR